MASKNYLIITLLISFLILVISDNHFYVYDSTSNQQNGQENKLGCIDLSTKADEIKYEKSISHDYEHFPGFNYYKVHKTEAVWADARDICKNEGAYLAVPNSKEEADLLAAIFNLYPLKSGCVWIGISDFLKREHFVSVKNEVMNNFVSKNWAPGEPEQHGRGFCLCLNKQTQLGDVHCYSNLHFICEKELINN